MNVWFASAPLLQSRFFFFFMYCWMFSEWSSIYYIVKSVQGCLYIVYTVLIFFMEYHIFDTIMFSFFVRFFIISLCILY